MKRTCNATPAGWLTEPEAAARMGLASATLATRRREGGDVPRHITTGARRHLYRETDVELWLAARTTDPAADTVASLIEESRTPRRDVPTHSDTATVGSFTLTAGSSAELQTALTMCPESLTALDLAVALAQTQSLGTVTWEGRMPRLALRGVSTSLLAHMNRHPATAASAAALAATCRIHTALINGANNDQAA
ncbi:AlpA family transcriptional regulator [Corynebacterium sp. HMSC064E07]|uniref:helix-turn-helix transcriptional regulator n=1 Tax=Corynebacterium sp. HMSC064E07 TaxID=1739545 RepID=UPI00114C9FA1|nr:hypothetical protein [Corynebacterium sp. HMSC064E07]